MTTEPLRIGLIGAGAVAQAYAEAFRSIDSALVVAVADVRVNAASSLGEQLDCPSFTSHDTMVKRTEVDAALVCTPPATHADLCRFFLQRDIAVQCEKPLTTSRKRAETLVALSQERGVVLAMASKFRYVEDLIRARSIIASGLVGEVVSFDNTFTARVNMRHRWNADPAVSGGGVLIDNGTHSVDIARYLVGPITDVLAAEGPRVQDLAVEDSARLLIRTLHGAVGAIDLSWSLDRDHDTYVEVMGTEGTIRVGWQGSRYRQTSSPEWVTFGEGYDKVDALAGQLDNFAAAVAGKERLLIGLDDALASVAVIEAAYTSLRKGRWVPVLGAHAPVSANEAAAAPAAG